MIMKKYFLFLFLTSFSVAAIETESVDQNILTIEHALTSNTANVTKDKLEKLKYNLVLLKEHSEDLKKGEGLNEVISLAEKKGWSNLLNSAKQVKVICESSESSSDECFIALSKFDQMVRTRNISADSKDHLTLLSNKYSRYKEARLIINELFIKTTNEILADIDKSIEASTAPIATAPVQKAVNVPAFPVAENLVATKMSFFTPYVNWIAQQVKYILGSITLLACAFILCQRARRKKASRKFYLNILFSIKKFKTPGRLFGKITEKKLVAFKKIERPYLDVLAGSKILQSQMDIHIRTKETKLVLEAIIHNDRTIQDILSLDGNRDLAGKFVVLEKELQAQNGELEYTNFFNYKGELVSVGFTLRS